MRADPRERVALKLVRETDAGVVISGRLGMHTSPAYAEDVYIGALTASRSASTTPALSCRSRRPASPRYAARSRRATPNPFVAPLSSRFDELDGQMWLDDVFVPWERVFFVEPSPEPIAAWLRWHHLYGWLAKAEFTLGLALALTHAMGLKEHEQTIEYLVDLVVEVQTVRSCLTAAERDPDFTGGRLLLPQPRPSRRPAASRILRRASACPRSCGSCPARRSSSRRPTRDLAAPEMAAGLEEAFGGGGYTALQRAALLQLAWDHVSSALDGRESAFELHASGGMPAWRGRLRR